MFFQYYYPSELLSVEKQATREQFQNREINGNQTFFHKVATFLLNDEGIACGGVPLPLHPELQSFASINPHNIMEGNFINAITVYEIYKDIKKQYYVVYSRYSDSGIHNNDHDCWNYCGNKTDLLYLPCCIKSLSR